MGRILKGVGYFFGAVVLISALSQCGNGSKKDTGTGYSGPTSTQVQEPPKVVDAATINDALKGLSLGLVQRM